MFSSVLVCLTAAAYMQLSDKQVGGTGEWGLQPQTRRQTL